MNVHYVLNLASLVFTAIDANLHSTRGVRIVDLGSELLMHFTSIIISQFEVGPASASVLEVMLIVGVLMLMVLNITHMATLVI